MTEEQKQAGGREDSSGAAGIGISALTVILKSWPGDRIEIKVTDREEVL